MRRPVVGAITLITSLALAHVAPSVDDNNRYLKLTPLADRVRLVYTVFFGENPGARARPGLDSNRDGTISDAEAQVYGDKLAAEVAAALDVTLDGVQTPVVWSEVAVGMGSPAVKAGSFSVDLIAHLCLASPGGRHRVQLRDRFKLPRPGETEVKLEQLPGVTIEAGRVGPASDPRHEYRFVGPGGPLADDGIDLAFIAGDQAPTTGPACGATPTTAPHRGLPAGCVVGSAAVLGCVLAALVTVVLRRRPRSAR